MIAAEQVGVLRAGRPILAHIDLALAPGAVTAFVGPNGAGKSTLIRVLSGEVSPSSGTVRLDGCPLGMFGPRALAARRAVLAQANDAVPGFTVAELAALGVRLLPSSPGAQETGALIAEALSQVGLGAMAGRSIAHLSGGERQRAHLARVLVQLRAGAARHGPGVLLLDEPIAAQDLAHQLRLLEIARDHARAGGAVALVLHDLNWAARIADRIVVLHQGGIHADGAPARVLTRAMLTEVFGVDLDPAAVPTGSGPFVLPQFARIHAVHDQEEGDCHVYRHESLQGAA